MRRCSRSAAPSSATYSPRASLASTPGGAAAGGGGQYGGHYVNNTHPRYYISTKKSLIKLYVDKQASPYWEAFNVEGRRCENLLECEVARYDEVIFTILTSAVKRSIGSTTDFHNYGEGTY